MNQPTLRVAALLPALLALAACGTSTPDATRPAPEGDSVPPLVSVSPTAPATPVTPPSSGAGGQDVCKTDADCVPAACCHSAACVTKDKAPACSGILCSQICQPGTIDCGGGCLCQDGRCGARLEANGKK